MRFWTAGKGTSSFINRRLPSLSSFLLAILVGLISSFTFSTAYDMTSSALLSKPQIVCGFWHGQWQGVHAVTIKLEQRGDSLSGTARFSRVIATSEGPKAIGESAELPLVNPKLDGDRLSFEVRGSDETYPSILAEMEMRFTGEGEAELRRTGGKPESTRADSRMSIKMQHERSF